MAPSAAAALLLFLFCALGAAVAEKSSYVVYLGDHAHGAQLGTYGAEELAALESNAADAHYDLLAGVLGDKDKAREAIFYSYTKHINGFAANLNAEEAAAIARQPGVVSGFPNRGRQLNTTRSWQCLGLAGPGGVPRGAAWRKARFGADTIIGNFDTGDNTAPMSSGGSSMRASGLAILLLAVSTGINFGDYGLLLGFLGVFVGSSLITIGVKMAGVTMTFGTDVLMAFRHRNLGIVGLVMASFAVTTSTGEAGIVLCFSMFVLLMLGVWLINIGIVGE